MLTNSKCIEIHKFRLPTLFTTSTNFVCTIVRLVSGNANLRVRGSVHLTSSLGWMISLSGQLKEGNGTKLSYSLRVPCFLLKVCSQ